MFKHSPPYIPTTTSLPLVSPFSYSPISSFHWKVAYVYNIPKYGPIDDTITVRYNTIRYIPDNNERAIRSIHTRDPEYLYRETSTERKER